MKRLLAAGTLALSAVLLTPPTAVSAAAAGLPATAPSQEPHRPLIPTTRTTVRHAARLAPGAAPASVTTTVTDADCSAPAVLTGPLGAGMTATGTARLDDINDPDDPYEGEDLLLERQDASGATTTVATINVWYSAQPYGFTASADGDRLVACIIGADGDEQATITTSVPPGWYAWTPLPGAALNSYPDCHPDAAGIGCWARSAAAQLVENDGPADGPRSWTTIGGSIAGPPTCLVRSARTDCFDSTSLSRLTW